MLWAVLHSSVTVTHLWYVTETNAIGTFVFVLLYTIRCTFGRPKKTKDEEAIYSKAELSYEEHSKTGYVII